MLREGRDVGSAATAGAGLLSFIQSALHECTRQEKTVALPMLLTLQVALQVRSQLSSWQSVAVCHRNRRSSLTSCPAESWSERACCAQDLCRPPEPQRLRHSRRAQSSATPLTVPLWSLKLARAYYAAGTASTTAYLSADVHASTGDGCTSVLRCDLMADAGISTAGQPVDNSAGVKDTVQRECWQPLLQPSTLAGLQLRLETFWQRAGCAGSSSQMLQQYLQHGLPNVPLSDAGEGLHQICAVSWAGRRRQQHSCRLALLCAARLHSIAVLLLPGD